MKILIFFEFSNHNQTIDDLCDNLTRNGVDVSSFNVVTWRFRCKNYKERPLWLRILTFLMFIPLLRGLLIRFLRDKVMLKLANNYHIIDIHFFSTVYDKIIEELKSKEKKIKITIWGSDFYRADKVRHENQRKIYKSVDIIQIETQKIANDFIKVFPEFAGKIRLAHFGIRHLEIIDELLLNGSSDLYKREMKLPEDKIIFTCGTNRMEAQQHLLMLESIEKLIPELKEQLFLLLPMTYGGNLTYVKEIRRKAEAIGLPYKILASYLSINNICKLRIVSDITLTIQRTDALSSAIQEHIYTENIFIAGDWLPYHVIKEYGVFYVSTSQESLLETISETIKNYYSLKKLFKGNSVGISKFSAWNNAIINWLTIYKELLSL